VIFSFVPHASGNSTASGRHTECDCNKMTTVYCLCNETQHTRPGDRLGRAPTTARAAACRRARASSRWPANRLAGVCPPRAAKVSEGERAARHESKVVLRKFAFADDSLNLATRQSSRRGPQRASPSLVSASLSPPVRTHRRRRDAHATESSRLEIVADSRVASRRRRPWPTTQVPEH
jgi:hypothetical protein